MTTVRLSDLLKEAPPTALCGQFPAEEAIAEIVCDSRRASENRLFVAIRGAAADGHDYLLSSYRAGCRVFAVTHFCDALPTDALQLRYEDTRAALALLAAAFYRHPTDHLRVVGVTGTKGKTTTCLLTYAMLTACNIPVGYIGTNGVLYRDHQETTANTTPESLILQRIARDMVDHGVEVLLLEVSSQALIQHRVDGISFDTVVYTNLYRDHIGASEHPDMNAYKAAKRRLFAEYPSKTVILNADDPHAGDMIHGANEEKCLLWYSGEGRASATLRAHSVTPTMTAGGEPGITFLLGGLGMKEARVDLPLAGKYNVGNALAATAICHALGIDVYSAVASLASAHIPGRCETITCQGGPHILIDYAHNEKSLSELLVTMRDYLQRDGRLIVLFGSVGERTRERRAAMGAVASEYADLCILTSDNPGAEEPMEIIREIRRGFVKDTPCLMIPDREEAICTAVSLLHAHDILILAGKGHESYQLIGKEKIPFSEREIVLRALSAGAIVSPQM